MRTWFDVELEKFTGTLNAHRLACTVFPGVVPGRYSSCSTVGPNAARAPL